MGILPRGLGGFKYLFVRIDTFTKWMEVVSAVNITHEATVKFLQSIIYRFDVPRRVLTNNGTKFEGRNWHKELPLVLVLVTGLLLSSRETMTL
jgi:hypothetical protein